VSAGRMANDDYEKMLTRAVAEHADRQGRMMQMAGSACFVKGSATPWAQLARFLLSSFPNFGFSLSRGFLRSSLWRVSSGFIARFIPSQLNDCVGRSAGHFVERPPTNPHPPAPTTQANTFQR